MIAGLILHFHPLILWIPAIVCVVTAAVALLGWKLDRSFVYWSAVVVASIAFGTIIVWFVFFDFPTLVISGKAIVGANARAERQNEVRTAAVQAALGVTVVLGAVYTARTFRITREGHLTERLSTAVWQLEKEADVRTGAIVALERLAKDSKRDRPAILELLTAYVQARSLDPAPFRLVPGAPRPRLHIDLQAALTAITRLINTVDVPRPLDLSELNLRGAGFEAAVLSDRLLLTDSDLSGARLNSARARGVRLSRADLTEAIANDADLRNAELGGALLDGTKLDRANMRDAQLPSAQLPGAVLVEAHLERCNMTATGGDEATIADGAHLEGAILVDARFNRSSLARVDARRADFRGATFRSAILREAKFHGAHLERVDFTGAHLGGADLSDAHLDDATLAESDLSGATLTRAVARRTRLSRANLTGARLQGADLAEAHLDGAVLTGARYDDATVWPAGFTPEAHGALKT